MEDYIQMHTQLSFHNSWHSKFLYAQPKWRDGFENLWIWTYESEAIQKSHLGYRTVRTVRCDGVSCTSAAATTWHRAHGLLVLQPKCSCPNHIGPSAPLLPSLEPLIIQEGPLPLNRLEARASPVCFLL